jgi:hypothetical protein
LFCYQTQTDDTLYVLYEMELSAVPDMKLVLHVFRLPDEIGAKA